jgi:hypothetical protein
MLLWRVICEIGRDFRSLGQWYKKEADAMNVGRILLSFVGIILTGAGVYATWNTAFSITIPLLGLLLFLVGYFSIVIRRCRLPELEVGELVADDSGASCCFHIRVKNKGPGDVRPTVTITHLTDNDGKPLFNVPESTQASEVHWRGAREVNWNPKIKKGVSAFAGVFEVQGKGSRYPCLCTYPNELNAPRPLWTEPTLIKDQKAMQLTLLISYKSSQDVGIIERHYLITPDADAPLQYRIKRVKKFG